MYNIEILLLKMNVMRLKIFKLIWFIVFVGIVLFIDSFVFIFFVSVKDWIEIDEIGNLFYLLFK